MHAHSNVPAGGVRGFTLTSAYKVSYLAEVSWKKKQQIQFTPLNKYLSVLLQELFLVFKNYVCFVLFKKDIMSEKTTTHELSLIHHVRPPF